MKSKILSLFFLAAIFSIMAVSATVDFNITPSTLAFTKTSNTLSFDIKNTGNETANFTIPQNIKIKTLDVTFSSNSFSLNAGIIKTLSVSVPSEDLKNLLGEYSQIVSIVVAGTSGNLSKDLTLKTENAFCESGKIGKLSVDKVKFNNKGFQDSEFGDNDEWYLLSEIEVTVTIENLDNSNDIDNVIVAWGLYDKNAGEFIIDDEENDFDIKDGEKESVTFSLILDPEDFDSEYGEDDFAFLVKAYSDDEGEDVQCDWYQEDVKIIKNKNFVALNNVVLTENVPCGGVMEISGEAWNIGDNDESDVSLGIYNKELGIDETIQLGDMDMLDYKDFSLDIMMPKDAEEKIYEFEFKVYDEDEDVFETDDDDESKFLESFTLTGNCKAELLEPRITAELDSETPDAIAGEEVIIKATIKNNGEEDAEYTISVTGNSAWSSLVDINPKTLTINAGESKDVTITLSLDKDSEGDKEFTIKADYGEAQTKEQKVALTILNKSGAGITGSAVVEHIKQNGFIYAIVFINIILIIAIISVVRRMSSGPQMA